MNEHQGNAAFAGLKYDTESAAKFHALAELFPLIEGEEFGIWL